MTFDGVKTGDTSEKPSDDIQQLAQDERVGNADQKPEQKIFPKAGICC